MLKRTHKIFDIGILILIFLVSINFYSGHRNFIGSDGTQSNLTEKITHQYLPDFLQPKLASETGYNERLYVDINPEGHVYSEYGFGGPNIQLAGEALEMIKNNYPEEFAAFRWGDWWLGQAKEQWDHNSRVELTFETADHEEARGWANWMMGFVNAFVYTDYYEDGVWSWDEEWDGTWHTVTKVSFSTRVEWPLVLEEYNGLIPREYGGIAETINITDASALRMWMWNGGDRIYQSFGASWDNEVPTLVGGFHFEIRDFIPFTILQRSPYQQSGDPLEISWRLPDLENLTYSAGCFHEYHPNIEEPWNKHDYYSVTLRINEGDSYTECWVEFDTTFQPWETLPVEKVWIEVNPYGYDFTDIQVQHENAYFYDLYQYVPIMPEMFHISFRISKADPWNNRNDSVARINVYFLHPGDHQLQINTLISDLQSTYNWVLTESSNWSEWIDWREFDSFESDHWQISFNTSDTFANWTDYLTNSWIYSQSDMLKNSDLTGLDSYVESLDYSPRMGGYWISDLEGYWNSIDVMTKNPTKKYSEIDPNPHSFDFASHFGWSRLNVSNGFHHSEYKVRLPVTNEWDGFNITYPEYNNGYGFNMWYDFNWDYNNVQMMELSGEIYTNNASYEKDSTTHYVDNFQLDFNYDFHPDTDDVIPPGGQFGWYNNTLQEPIFEGHPQFWDKGSFSGQEKITFNAWDNTWLNWWGNQVYNGTDINGDPQFYNRFPTSDIVNVTYDVWWSDLAIWHEDFHWFYQMDYNSSQNYWYHDLNTTMLADGWYSLDATVTDSSNNIGWSGWSINVDNFNESYINPADVEFLAPTPANNSAVNDTVTFRLNLTDDIGVFGAVYTKDGTGYVLDDDNYVSEGIYEITWNTLTEPENSWHLFSITVWDMEGHKTVVYYSLQVDNLHAGDPPVIEIVSPNSPNQELQGVYTFQVNITDDWGISSAQGRIDSRVEEDLYYNYSTNLWEYTFNVSTLLNGSHTFTVKVIDVDDPQHQREVSIDFIALTDITDVQPITPPDYRNVLPGNFTSADDIFTSPIDFSIEVSDEDGIATVQIKIYEVTGVNPTDVNTPGDVDLTDVRIMDGYPKDMDKGSTDGDWTIYTNTWDISQASSGLYLAEIVIADNAVAQGTTTVKMLVIVKNTSIAENPFGNIPGFPVGLLLLMLGISAISLYKRTRRD